MVWWGNLSGQEILENWHHHLGVSPFSFEVTHLKHKSKPDTCDIYLPCLLTPYYTLNSQQVHNQHCIIYSCCSALTIRSVFTVSFRAKKEQVKHGVMLMLHNHLICTLFLTPTYSENTNTKKSVVKTSNKHHFHLQLLLTIYVQAVWFQWKDGCILTSVITLIVTVQLRHLER